MLKSRRLFFPHAAIIALKKTTLFYLLNFDSGSFEGAVRPTFFHQHF
jgi:hypothetical protein